MIPHYEYNLGYLSIGGFFSQYTRVRVEVKLNYAANVMLLDDQNYERYYREDSYTYFGGYVTRSPYYIYVPHTGNWRVVIDNGGNSMHGIESSVHTSRFHR